MDSKTFAAILKTQHYNVLYFNCY